MSSESSDNEEWMQTIDISCNQAIQEVQVNNSKDDLKIKCQFEVDKRWAGKQDLKTLILLST